MPDDLAERLQTALGGSYIIERELGGGGMSRVFVAEEVQLKRKVVVKILPPDSGFALNPERFEREIQLAARLQHPHIVPVLSAGAADGTPFYTMPLVEGESLRERMGREGRMPIAETIRILSDVAGALAYSHARGIVHRDIKPANILLSGGHALVVDFGVAKAIAEAGESLGGEADITGLGVTLGTPGYMAPEQATADHVDFRADLYSLGAVGYEMLAGERLFPAKKGQALLAAQITESPPSLAEKNPQVPAKLADLISRCLEKSADQRPQNAAEVQSALANITAGVVSRVQDSAQRENKAVSSRGARWRVAIAALVLGLVAVIVVIASYRRQHTTALPPLLAVMPFENMSGVRENEYFSDGMTEELIQSLRGVEGLTVASRSSSFAFKGKKVTPQEVSDRLHVTHVIEGSVRQSGDRLRVTAELVSTKDGASLWSNTYDRRAQDVFAVQDEISASIVSALRSMLPGRSAPAPKERHDIRAYDLYLRGRYFWAKRTPDGLRKGAEYFGQAIAIDSTFARAWAGLADSYAVLAAFGEDPRAAYQRAIPAARKALELDSTLAEAHTSLGFAHLFYSHDPVAARREFDKAISLDPRYATAHLFKAWYYVQVADMEGALRAANTARELEPLSLIVNARLGFMLSAAGRNAEAEAQLRKTLELDSTFAVAHDEIARLLSVQGRHEEAIAHARRGIAAGNIRSSSTLGYALARSGARAEARHIADSLIRESKRRWIPPFDVAYIEAGLGNDDAALDWMERGYRESDHDWNGMKVEPRLAGLRSNPRFRVVSSIH